MKIALITGATSGIGRAAAFKFSENGYNVIITGRRKERLNSIAREIRKKSGAQVHPLCFDIRSMKEVQKSVASLPGQWKKIDVLVNNAGLAAGLSDIQDGNAGDWETMIDTNIKGLLYISKAVIPLFIKNGTGHIINIGSIAGKETYAKGNVYCATKHAVDALTKSMRIDLLSHGIRVTGIHPGAVETEFSLVRFHGDEQKAKNVYRGFTPLSADDVADAICWAASRPAHVNINEMVIMPAAQANTQHLNRKV